MSTRCVHVDSTLGYGVKRGLIPTATPTFTKKFRREATRPRPWPKSSPPLGWRTPHPRRRQLGRSQQNALVDAERRRERNEHADRQVRSTPLDVLHVARLDARLCRECLLRQAPEDPEAPHVRADVALNRLRSSGTHAVRPYRLVVFSNTMYCLCCRRTGSC